MTESTLTKLNHLSWQMKQLADEFRLDPSREGQFASRIVAQSMAGLSMLVGNEYGLKLHPVEAKAAEDAVVVEEIKEIVKKAKKPIEFEADLPTVNIADVGKASPAVTVGRPKAKK